MKFGPLILREILKTVAIRCQILRIKCTKMDVGWVSAPGPLGELTVFSHTPSWNKGGLLLTEGEIGGRGRGMKGKAEKGGREGIGRLGEGKD